MAIQLELMIDWLASTLALLWKYLQKDYKGRDPFKGWATCTMCEHQMQYAFRYGNTYGNLKTHLRIKHAIDFWG